MNAERPDGPQRREVVLSHFSLTRLHPIEDRVRLAAAHGFRSIGLYVGQYIELERDGFAPHGLAELLDRYGVRLREIEVVSGLGRDGLGGERAAQFEDAAFRMADAFGCRYLQVIGSEREPITNPAAAFGALCDRAADHGLVLGLEFLPFSDIVDIVHARHIVEEAGRANGGLCVDIWHHARGLNSLDAIAATPGELITSIQFNDGPVAPDPTVDYKTDCLASRVPPGTGEFDVAGFVAALRATGTTAPVSLEVCNLAGWEQPDLHVAAIAAATSNYFVDA